MKHVHPSIHWWFQVVWWWREHGMWVGMIWFQLLVLYLPVMWPWLIHVWRSQRPQLHSGTEGSCSSEVSRGCKRESVTEKRRGSSCLFGSFKVLTSPQNLPEVQRAWEPIPDHNGHQLLALPQHLSSPCPCPRPLHCLQVNLWISHSRYLFPSVCLKVLRD